MICTPCKLAAEMNTEGNGDNAKRYHDKCEGCCCQHGVGGGHYARTA